MKKWVLMKMNSMMNDDLIYEVLEAVAEIPEGKVATYGQIARLIDRPRNARLIGRILSRAQMYGKYPCHRVVNHVGRLAPGWAEQKNLLEAEAVPMKEDGYVDIKKCQWEI